MTPLTPAELADLKARECAQIKAGQIWREVDPRFERHIRVRHICVGGKTVAIETVIKGTDGWKRKSKSHMNEVSAHRFDGKRGGYALHEDVKP